MTPAGPPRSHGRPGLPVFGRRPGSSISLGRPGLPSPSVLPGLFLQLMYGSCVEAVTVTGPLRSLPSPADSLKPGPSFAFT